MHVYLRTHNIPVYVHVMCTCTCQMYNMHIIVLEIVLLLSTCTVCCILYNKLHSMHIILFTENGTCLFHHTE